LSQLSLLTDAQEKQIHKRNITVSHANKKELQRFVNGGGNKARVSNM
jgi:hypothetical protein